jgi:hypothetical protein
MTRGSSLKAFEPVDDADDAPLALSREDLYELAWSKPISELAKDFGISDVGLAKRCRKLGIPLPGRGYWARVDAGQNPYKAQLPKREPQYGDYKALKVAPSPGAFGHNGTSTPAEPSEDRATIAAKIAVLDIPQSSAVHDCLAPVKRTALLCKRFSRVGLKFAHDEKSGPIVELRVTDEAAERALLLADSILRAAAALGWEFDVPKALYEKQSRTPADDDLWPERTTEYPALQSVYGRLLIDGEQVAFFVEERYREQAYVPTERELKREQREYGYHAPRKVSVATGALRVIRLDTYQVYKDPDKRIWYDRKGSRVEDQLADILLGLYELAASIRERRAESERKAREAEAEQRRKEEREAIQAAHQKLIKQLETDAGAWHRARYLRRYVTALRRRLRDQNLCVSFRKETVNFLDWAESYINQLDPLEPAPRTREFKEGSTGYYHNDLESMKKAFGRLLGSDWSDAWKIGKDYTPPSKTDRYSYSYREKSVFEISPAEPDEDG